MDNQDARPKFTKEEVHYGESSDPAKHRCGICSFLLDVPPRGSHIYACGIVSGPIDEMYGCKFFDSNLIKAANDKLTLLSNPPAKQ